MKIFWLILPLFVAACGGNPPPVPAQAEIYYRDSQGHDLLDPTSPGYFHSVIIQWNNPDGTIGSNEAYISKQSVVNAYSPYLPNGYSFSITPSEIVNNKGNSGLGNGIVKGNTGVLYIQLNKIVTDTITFIYSGSTLQKFFYNKMLITPPAPMTTYPTYFPAIITK